MNSKKLPPSTQNASKDQGSKTVADRLTDEEIAGILGKSKADKYALPTIMKEIREEIARTAADRTKERTKQDDEAFHDSVRKLVAAKGLENHYFMLEGISERHKPLALEFARQLELEYDCKTASEKALIEIVASAYVRYLANVTEFGGIGELNFLSNEKLTYYSIHSKEADRAYRQFVGGLLSLKQLKSPKLELVVKAKTAYVAEKQQVNMVTPAQAEAQALREEGNEAK